MAKEETIVTTTKSRNVTILTAILFMLIGFGIVQWLIGREASMIEKEHWFLYGLAGAVITVIFISPFLVSIYFMHPRKWIVLFATIIVGWTGFGWMGCLLYAIYSKPKQAAL